MPPCVRETWQGSGQVWAGDALAEGKKVKTGSQGRQSTGAWGGESRTITVTQSPYDLSRPDYRKAMCDGKKGHAVSERARIQSSLWRVPWRGARYLIQLILIVLMMPSLITPAEATQFEYEEPLRFNTACIVGSVCYCGWCASMYHYGYDYELDSSWTSKNMWKMPRRKN